MGRPVLIIGRREPFKLFLLALCVYTGVRQFLVPGEPDQVPWWALGTWYVVLVVFGAAGLVGAAWRDPVTGLLVERVALTVLGFVALVYAVVVAIFGGLVGAGVVAAFSVTCGVRVWRITADLRRAAG